MCLINMKLPLGLGCPHLAPFCDVVLPSRASTTEKVKVDGTVGI
jgi:hypothetical protein